MEKRKEFPTPPVWLAIIPVFFTTVALAFSVFVFDVEPHFSILMAAAVAGLCANLYGFSWKTILLGMKEPISRTIPAIFILLIIGMLIAVWIASGIVPALMLWGFDVFVARWFLPLILLICSFMALITGSSWSTIGTFGIVAIGVSEALGVPQEMTAGAVVSGAFFGDKISPMSDSTNLTSTFLGVDLYEHIKHMLYSTLPVLGISIIVFTIIGFNLSGDENMRDVTTYAEGIKEIFSITPWLLLPPLTVVLLIVKKVPAIPSLLAGLLLGGIAFLLLQGGNMAELLKTIQTGYLLETGDQELDKLFSRGGLESMYNVVGLALVSLAFGGIMNKTGMLRSLVLKIAPFVYKKIGNLTVAVLGSAIFINTFSANQYLAVILPGQMFEECYRDKRLKLKNLTRTLEAGGTLTAPLIPWNSSAVFIAAALGISATSYAPYAVLCWLTPIVNAIYAYTKTTMTKLDVNEMKEKDADE